MSAILQFNIACRISLFQICTQCFGSIFCYITAIVYADQFGILIYQLGDHITGHLYHIGANGYNTLITDTHEVILLDLLVIDHGITMVARIGFAIATITKPDILIADEVLSVGDFLFQQKCEKRMKELMAGGTTVILVSHSIEQIERMCSKVAWLSHGHLKMNGDTETVCAAYKATQRGEA